MQDSTRHLVTYRVAVLNHLGPVSQHFWCDFEHFAHDRRRAFFLRKLKASFPANHGEGLSHFFSKSH